MDFHKTLFLFLIVLFANVKIFQSVMALIYYEEVKNSVLESSLKYKEEKEALFCSTRACEYTLVDNLECSSFSWQNFFEVISWIVCTEKDQRNCI